MAEIQHSPNTRAYDLFKAIVAAILLLIIIILLLRGAGSPRAVTPTAETELTAAPTLSLPGQPNADGAFTFKGTGTPGSKVEVWSDGKLLGSATVGADGTWALDADLPAGKHTLTARTVDASGKLLAESAPLSWEAPAVPIAAAVAPVLTLPEQPNADGKFSLKGTGTPGSKVEVWSDGKLLGSTTVGADGTWALDADLPAGKHTLTARTVDASGKLLAESAPLSWEAPAVPIAAAVAPTLTLPEQPNADGKFSLKGTGTPGSKVEVWSDGKLLGSTTVGADGTWSLDADLPAGKHTLTTRTVDASGKVLAESAPLSWEAPAVPSAAAVAPTLTLPEQPNADGKFSLKGTGTPGSKVEVWSDGKLLGSTTVGADGTWSLDADLPAGKHTLTTRTVDASGKVLAESAPLSWEVPALAVPSAAVAPTLTLPEQPNADGKFSLKGTGTPGSKVEVWSDGKLLGSTTVGADGTWSLDADLPAGKHTLTTRTVDASGKLLAESAPLSWEVPALAVPSAAAVAPTLTLPEKFEAGKPVKLSGTGTPGAEIEIFEDGKVIGKATVGADGTWTYSYTPSAGEHTLLVRAAGDANLASAPAKLSMPATADATAPAPVTLPAAGAACGVGEDRGATYVVAQCEYMALIANRTGVTLEALIAANPEVTNPDLIYPGQILNLPPR